jgi:hypothetical protein
MSVFRILVSLVGELATLEKKFHCLLREMRKANCRMMLLCGMWSLGNRKISGIKRRIMMLVKSILKRVRVTSMAIMMEWKKAM